MILKIEELHLKKELFVSIKPFQIIGLTQSISIPHKTSF